MCSESLPLITSPRISFSHDLNEDDDEEVVVVETEENQEDSSTMDISNILDDDHGQLCDFSFSDGFTFEPSSSSADELFSDGLIRPLQLEEKFVTFSKHTSILPQLTHNTSINDDQGSINPSSLKETNIPKITYASSTTTDDVESDQKNQSNNKSFWNIKRSSSVHIDNSHKKSSFWSLPLMLRSNSTGSAPSIRQVSKDNKKQNSKNQLKGSAASSSFYMYQLSQKPPLKKNHGGYHGNGVWINPVLNVPPPYIAKGTASLFGITSLFKDKKVKQTKK